VAPTSLSLSLSLPRPSLHCLCHLSGLYRVIHPDLLGMFCAPELQVSLLLPSSLSSSHSLGGQVLISGACVEISIDDLSANTRYAAGYHPLDRTIARLWEVVREMSEADRGLFIKFVTSCERPPSLGFGALNPPFTIQVLVVRFLPPPLSVCLTVPYPAIVREWIAMMTRVCPPPPPASTFSNCPPTPRRRSSGQSYSQPSARILDLI
jgi:hypothetical protein